MNTRNVNFEDLANSNNLSAASLMEDVIVIDREILTSKHVLNPEISPPVRYDAHAFIICTYGEISVSVDYKPYSLTRGSMLVMSSFRVIDNVHVRNNCRATGIIISRNLVMSIRRDKSVAKKIMPDLKNRPEPVIKLEFDEMCTLTEIILRIKNNLKKTGHAFQNVIVRNETSNFIMEVLNIFVQRSGIENQKDRKESRKDEIFQAFMPLLIKHFREQHEVAYYAAELGMTPDNFSRSVIGVSGKSPVHWINDMLASEAKTLLHKPDANIKEVVDELHFGDQPSFSKFFKRQTGMTPGEYRKSAG